jgi:hypothetical protein
VYSRESTEGYTTQGCATETLQTGAEKKIHFIFTLEFSLVKHKSEFVPKTMQNTMETRNTCTDEAGVDKSMGINNNNFARRNFGGQ